MTRLIDGDALLEALEKEFGNGIISRPFLTAIKNAPTIEADSGEAVAWRYVDSRGHYRYRGYRPNFDIDYKILKPIPLFTSPPKREWIGLTNEQTQEIIDETGNRWQFASAISNKLKEVNGYD